VSRGRKVKRHDCHVIGMCRKERMERSCADAPPAREPENIEAAREQETNASEPLAAPEAAGRRETKEPCPMETAKSTGARETNMPEERSAAVRRDGEPLANAAKRRRQKEAVADEHQVAAGEQPPSPMREESGTTPPSDTDPAVQPQEAADADRRQSPAADTGHEEAAHRSSVYDRDFEEIIRQEAREMLTGYLRNGTDCLSASTARQIV
jgi:hypothetical protein